ncbi:MAG: cysteine desulfurase [Candidatus Sungiibacteriota bacterium]|uniref:Cysteine desulfurase n=1 Tax=Candidatus Sungiibacteriota bacterium TaxID=2750080 RepID=A0A7T5RKF5_9BACT|nr:MAG: cysteine desulfurase [Candidatus Sungbacteria bacterium]
MSNGVYLDHAATTYLDPRVAEAMEPYWEEEYGNPSSLYRPGRRAKESLDSARSVVARLLNCKSEELVFTGGGTEAINLAIFGVARMYKDQGRHIITSKIEHHAVLHSLEALEKEGFSAGGGPASGWEVTYLDVDEYGLVRQEEIKKAIRPYTILVSIMYANNEIGTIEPIEEIGKIIKEIREERKVAGNPTPIFFHTDACQAAGALDMDVQKLGVDLLAMNGSKIYGPKGVGCLYIRRGIRLRPLIYGGGQENNLRSGTENIPGIIGFAKAFELAQEEREKENARLLKLRDYFISEVMKRVPKIVLNGHPKKRLPNNINISVLDIEGEAVILYLDAKGIYISTGSACTSTTLDPSHVILAIGRPYEYAHGSLRFTLGRRTTKEDLDYVLEVFPGIVEKLRKISPVRLEIGQKTVSHPEAFAGQGSKIKVGGKNYK